MKPKLSILPSEIASSAARSNVGESAIDPGFVLIIGCFTLGSSRVFGKQRMIHSRNILVRGPNWIGDFVMARDFFRGLRHAYPDSRITLAAPTGMESIAERGVFNDFLELDAPKRSLWRGALFWKRLRPERYDLGVCVPASFSAAALLRLAGVGRLVGFSEPLSRPLFHSSHMWKGRSAGKHKAQLYREMLTLLSGKPAEASALVDPALSRKGGIVLAPSASIALRQWPGFLELAKVLRKKYPEKVIRFVGGPADREVWEPRIDALGDPYIESFIGLTSLSELEELCREADFVVANDSGIAHLSASLSGAPTFVTFGPGDPHYIRPVGKAVVDLRASGVPCSPCEKAVCKSTLGYQYCLKALSVDAVLSAIEAKFPSFV
jgi:heptosyltransferase II